MAAKQATANVTQADVDAVVAAVKDADLTPRARWSAKCRIVSKIETSLDAAVACELLHKAAQQTIADGEPQFYADLADFAGFAGRQSPAQRRADERRARNAYRF